MPVAKIVPPGPIAMKRGLVRPAAKTFALKPAGRVSVRGSASRPLRNCGATSSVTGARAPSTADDAGVVGAGSALGFASEAAADVAGSAVGMSGAVAAIVATTVASAEVVGVAAAAAGELVAAGLTAEVQPTKATRTMAMSGLR